MSSSNGKKRRFKNVRRREEFEVEQPDGKIEEFYVLGLMGDEREAYMGFMARKTKTTAKGSGSVTDLKGMHAELLTRTVFHAKDDSPVSAETVNSWTGEIQGEVFAIAQELSALNATGEAEAKNS